uniref:Uncharacterized protein n=1 Tax=Triticum urartu TaxID=4572 RepID=A0A8R7R1D8_TRIUA
MNWKDYRASIMTEQARDRICNSSVCYMGCQTKEVHNMNDF